MRTSELAKRYARAAFDLATEQGIADRVFADLRSLEASFEKNPAIAEFFASPMVQPEQKEAALKAALEGGGAAAETAQLLQLLARKKRLGIFADVVGAFQNRSDEVNGVGRGVVRSAVALAPQERQQLEAIVEKVLKKKVIMTYTIDPSVIGGLVAQVGSYTFDDSIDSHLKRMTEELKRRTA